MKNGLNLNAMSEPETFLHYTEMEPEMFLLHRGRTKLKIIGLPSAKLKIEKDKVMKLLKNLLKKLQRKTQKLSNLGVKSARLKELLKKLNQNQKRKVGGKNWRKSKSRRKKKRNREKQMQKQPRLCPRQPGKKL